MFEFSELKSPKATKLSHFDDKSRGLCLYFEDDCLEELNEGCKVIIGATSINIVSTELFCLYSFKSFEGTSTLTNSIIAPSELQYLCQVEIEN